MDAYQSSKMMTVRKRNESRDTPVSGVSLPVVILEKEGGGLSVLRCPSPVGYVLVCLSADELRLVLVVLFSARCFTSELVHFSVDDQADGQVAFQTIVVSTFETVLVDTTEAESFVRIIGVCSIDSFPPCS